MFTLYSSAPSSAGHVTRRGALNVSCRQGRGTSKCKGYDGEVVTFLTSSGLLRLPGLVWPGAGELRRHEPLPTAEEQGLCLAETFLVKATNGHNPSRRVQLLGFCRSARNLSDVVEDAALRVGGEIYRLDMNQRGLAQTLQMTVGLPFLWGVPPAYDFLYEAITTNGGIVHQVSRQWVL